MNSKILQIIALISLIAYIYARDDPSYDRLFAKSFKKVTGQTQYWFNQI